MMVFAFYKFHISHHLPQFKPYNLKYLYYNDSPVLPILHVPLALYCNGSCNTLHIHGDFWPKPDA